MLFNNKKKKRTSMKKSIAPLVIALSATLLASCGKDGGGGGSSDPSRNSEIQAQQAEGSYRAILRPFNNSLSGFLPSGAAEFKITGDTVGIKTYLDDDAKVIHMQNVHTGSRCPKLSDDTNGDGLIDINESMAVTGPVLLPLDADINSAAEGNGIFPMGDGFTYNELGSLSKLESDVVSRVGQNLNLAGRMVLIHGVNKGTQMPATIATKDSMPIQSSIPIACGIIQRLN
jgi:hypothetical protein